MQHIFARAHPSYSIVLMMNPSVGLTVFTSSFIIFFTIVVLPALSRPLSNVSTSATGDCYITYSIRILISLSFRRALRRIDNILESSRIQEEEEVFQQRKAQEICQDGITWRFFHPQGPWSSSRSSCFDSWCIPNISNTSVRYPCRVPERSPFGRVSHCRTGHCHWALLVESRPSKD